jgi:hypothetical protein
LPIFLIFAGESLPIGNIASAAELTGFQLKCQHFPFIVGSIDREALDAAKAQRVTHGFQSHSYRAVEHISRLLQSIST